MGKKLSPIVKLQGNKSDNPPPSSGEAEYYLNLCTRFYVNSWIIEIIPKTGYGLEDPYNYRREQGLSPF
jgi:hypothetical protein